MINFVIILVVAILLALIISFLLKAKKGGNKCVGCPDANCCINKNRCSSAKSSHTPKN
jgi:hypothetical protein